MTDCLGPLLLTSAVVTILLYLYLRPTSFGAQAVSFLLDKHIPRPSDSRSASTERTLWEDPAGRKLWSRADIASLVGAFLSSALFVLAVVLMPAYSMPEEQLVAEMRSSTTLIPTFIGSTSAVLIGVGVCVAILFGCVSKHLRRQAKWQVPPGTTPGVSGRWFWTTSSLHSAVFVAMPLALMAGGVAPRVLLVFVFVLSLIPSCVKISWELAHQRRRHAAAESIDQVLLACCVVTANVLLQRNSTFRLPSDMNGPILSASMFFTALMLMILIRREQTGKLTAAHHVRAAQEDARKQLSTTLSEYVSQSAAGTLTQHDEAQLWARACEARRITRRALFNRPQPTAPVPDLRSPRLN